MKAQEIPQRLEETALIYCRVSSKKQTVDGSGLQSQEHRCLAHALHRGYTVEKTFLEAVSGGLDITERPAMLELLRYLDSQRSTGKNYVVVFDDHKRFSRSTSVHILLKSELQKRGARVEFLNFSIDDNTPEGTFIDTMLAAQSQLEREQIGRQTKEKTRARLEKGYWTFRAPIGYKYVPSKQGGKELVKYEPLASIVKEALEGFATGRFATMSETQRFLESCPAWPKDLPDGRLRPQSVVRLMSKVLYAGYLEAPSWGISRRKALHSPIISLETYERIQQRRNNNGYLPTRKDVAASFPLRGAVCCSSCSHPFTAGFSKGKYKHYPYYFCQQRKCSEYGKSIPKAKLEGEFETLLKNLQPSGKLFRLVAAMFSDAWNAQIEISRSASKAYKQEAANLEKEINQIIERIMEASNPRVIGAYESKIDVLENKRLIALEKAEINPAPKKSFEEMFELSMRLLSDPHKCWTSGKFALQRIVLKLAFPNRLTYERNSGYRTPETALAFNVFEGFSTLKSKMVPRRRFELPTPSLLIGYAGDFVAFYIIGASWNKSCFTRCCVGFRLGTA